MAAALRKRYLRLVRRAYRLLRSPFMRRRPWLQRLLHPIFERELWVPGRDTVAHGAAIGLFVSQLPIPGQMLVAAFLAMRFQANVPISVASCWVTNPLTQIPIMLAQEQLGAFLRESLHIPIHPLMDQFSGKFPGVGELNMGSFILGFLAAGFLLMLVAYPAVYLFSAMLPKLLPKTPYQRAKAKVLKRKGQKLASSSPQPPS